LTIMLTACTYRHLLSAPHRILAARCEQKTCVAHQYSIVKDRPEKLRNQPLLWSGSFLLSSNCLCCEIPRRLASQAGADSKAASGRFSARSSLNHGGPG